MEDILEFIAEVLFDISVEVIQNKKISKWIRYPLFGFISVLYTFLIFILLYITISLLQRSEYLAASILGVCFVVVFVLFYYFLHELFRKGKDDSIVDEDE